MIHTLIVNVARSHPLALGFPGFGGSGLIRLGSMAVAIILADKTFAKCLGTTPLIFFPIELDNMMN